MKTLTKIALIAAVLTTAAAARAEWVRGYSRSSGTYVAPCYRTPANSMPRHAATRPLPNVTPLLTVAKRR